MLLVHGHAVSIAADEGVVVAGAVHRALRLGGLDGRRIELGATEALDAILDTKVGISGADRRARRKSHVVAGDGLSRQNAKGDGVGKAAVINIVADGRRVRRDGTNRRRDNGPVHAQTHAGTTKLARVARARHVAVRGRGGLGGLGIAAVALTAPLGTEVGVSLAVGGTLGRRHIVLGDDVIREDTRPVVDETAKIWGADIRDDRRRRRSVVVVDVDLQTGASTARLRSIARAGEVALGVGGSQGVGVGVELVAAVAFTAVLDAKKLVGRAILGARLDRHAVIAQEVTR